MKEVILVFIGSLYFTRGIKELVDDETFSREDLLECVHRHIRCDYGEMCEEDVEVNNQALDMNYGRVMSEYRLNDIRIWFITCLAGEQTYTTCLLPEEY